MRGTKAKAMRRADPSRPNPGRLQGGYYKDQVRSRTRTRDEAQNLQRSMMRRLMRGLTGRRG